jgi:hypothetical protein
MLKSQVSVNRENFYTITEHAMAECNNCNRNKKSCALRTALNKASIPKTNDGKGKCEFRWQD